MIEQLAIHRFRGIREGKLEDLGKINVLIGPNNSGKTAILEMLYFAGVWGRECGLVLEDGALFNSSYGKDACCCSHSAVKHSAFGWNTAWTRVYLKRD